MALLLRVPPPREIVAALDRYIVGQRGAKKTVAVALRNRWRRLQLPPEEAREIYPSNILMIGPTGVGKTEIARRVAQIVQAPFVKVEATRFTEVGYVGRDVESIIRDLADAALHLVRNLQKTRHRDRVREEVTRRLLQALLRETPFQNFTESELREKLTRGDLEDVLVEVEVSGEPPFQMFAPPGMEEFQETLMENLRNLFPQMRERRKIPVRQARELLEDEVLEGLVRPETLREEARELAENMGIVFLDEIDKIARRGEVVGADVSREGVQRDLLPIIEGTTVRTRIGPINTDHILFIAAGAFEQSRPSDLIPELQGRLPLRVELSPLGEEDLYRILTEPQNSLVRQYQALFRVEGVDLTFTEEALRKIAAYAHEANQRHENIGARRLHTVMGWIMEDLLYDLPKPGTLEIRIDETFVEKRLQALAGPDEAERYIL